MRRQCSSYDLINGLMLVDKELYDCAGCVSGGHAVYNMSRNLIFNWTSYGRLYRAVCCVLQKLEDMHVSTSAPDITLATVRELLTVVHGIRLVEGEAERPQTTRDKIGRAWRWLLKAVLLKRSSTKGKATPVVRSALVSARSVPGRNHILT